MKAFNSRFRSYGAYLLMVGAMAGVAYYGYVGFHKVFVKVGRTVEKPFSGPAGTDPFYVLRHYLEQRGAEVRVVRTWPQSLDEGTTVFWFSNEDEVPRSLRNWLAQGGRLWSFSDPDMDFEFASDWTPSTWLSPVDAGISNTGVSDAGISDAGISDAGISDTDTPDAGNSDAGALQFGGLDDALDDTPAYDDENAWRAEYCEVTDPGCITFGQFEYGLGRLTLVQRLGLTNERVHRGSAPAQIDALLGLPESPPKTIKVLMVYPLDAPWLGLLLLQHAPALLLALLVFVLLFLWRGSLHLGPRTPPGAQPRRQMGEHLDAVGVLSARTGSLPLIEAARAELREQLARVISRSSGRGSAELDDHALVEAAVEALGVSHEQAACALTDVATATPKKSLEIARAIQALWRQT